MENILFLSSFVFIPLLMLLGLWLSRNINQVRGVMVAGSTALLILAAYLTIRFLGDRAAGADAEMLYTGALTWFEPLHIKYSVGVDGISVAMLLLSAIIVFTGTFASWQLKPLTKEYFLWFTLLSMGVFASSFLSTCSPCSCSMKSPSSRCISSSASGAAARKNMPP